MNSLWNIQDWINENENNWVILLICFLGTQLLTCILSTLRSFFTVKGTKFTATFFTTAYCTVSTLVTCLIANLVTNITLVLIITFITNIIGTYCGLVIADKLRKDKLWRISTTVKKEQFESLKQELHNNNIDFITYKTAWEKRSPLDIFSHTREESSKIYKIIKKYDVKYTISSSGHQL